MKTTTLLRAISFSVFSLIISTEVMSQHLWLPSKADVLKFEETDERLITLHQEADTNCKDPRLSLETFFSCAKRDILTKSLEERGYCQSSECQPGQPHEWKPCGSQLLSQSTNDN